MKKIFTLIVALLAVFNTVKAEEIVLFEGSQVLSYDGLRIPTTSITATSDLTLNITIAHDGKWCQYAVCSNTEGWPKLALPGIAGEFVLPDEMVGFTWGTPGTCTNSFDLTPELIAALKAGGEMIIQGAGGEDGGTITAKKVTITTKMNYVTEGRNIAFDEWGSIVASEFNGLSDDAKIVFTYECGGEVSEYKGWGCGQLMSIDQSVNLNRSFPMGPAGENTDAMLLSDIKTALNTGPDQYGRYGLYWNVWGQGDGKATVKRVSVKAYEVVGFTGEGYKDPTSAGTGIENITAQPENNGEAYNIAGQRVNNSAKGLVIRNGKKFFVK